MYHYQGISFYVAFLCFICMFTGVICQLGSPGVCFEQFQVNNTQNWTNVLFVCTNSTTSTFTDTVYLDTGRVPLQETPVCFCSIRFKYNKMDYYVKLELKIGNIADNQLTVRGFGTTISPNNLQNASTIRQENSLMFSMTTGNQGLKACLRIMGLEQTDVFQAECFQRDSGHHGLDDNPTEVREDNPTEVPEDNPTDIQEGSSTEIPLQNPEEVTSEANPKTGAIIGGSIGGAVLVVLVVILTVILFKRRKRTTIQKEEDYYMSENPMYNKPKNTPQNLPDHPPITNDYQIAHDYDVIQSSDEIIDGTDYTAVDKGKATSNVQLGTQQENEYNHLNEIPVVAATGNVYSSTGNRNIESNTGDFYNCAANGVQKRSAQSKIAENVYDNRT